MTVGKDELSIRIASEAAEPPHAQRLVAVVVAAVHAADAAHRLCNGGVPEGEELAARSHGDGSGGDFDRLGLPRSGLKLLGARQRLVDAGAAIRRAGAAP